MEESKNKESEALEPKVLGIGGIFFFSDDPKASRKWYAENLGFQVTDWGASFETRSITNPDQTDSVQWSPFQTGNSYFSPSKKDFMINYRVQHIEALLTQLKTNGVTILDDIEDTEYGKFVHIIDPEGNKIELWEPKY